MSVFNGQCQVVVFDWDGTLVDSEQHIVASIRYAAEQLGLSTLAHNVIKNIIGLGMREALKELYPDLTAEQVASMRKHYAERFFQSRIDAANLFPSVVETLTALRRKGLKLAVATGKSRNGLDKALKSSGLGVYFDITRCADETLSKPDPLMLHEIANHYQMDFDAMLMIGDTTYDMEMAYRVSMPSVAVSYGVHDSKDLLEYKPIKIIDKLSEVLTLI